MLRILVIIGVIILIVFVFLQKYTAAIPEMVPQVILWITVLLFIIHLALKARKKDNGK